MIKSSFTNPGDDVMESILDLSAVSKTSAFADILITPQQIDLAHKNIKYTPAQLTELNNTLPPPGSEDFGIVASPPSSMSVIEIHRMCPGFFHPLAKDWLDRELAVANIDTTSSGWLKIQTCPLLNSLEEIWDKQIKLLSEDNQVPKLSDILWFSMNCYAVHGIRLFQGLYVRTATTDSKGNHVCVGYNDSGGMSICSVKDTVAYKILGLAVQTKKCYNNHP